jgi:hypothetical protein
MPDPMRMGILDLGKNLEKEGFAMNHVAFIVAALAGLSPALGANAAHGAVRTVWGTVISSTLTSLLLRTDDGDDMTFIVDAGSALPSELEAGARVRVEYETRGDDRFRAANVTPAADAPGTAERTDLPASASAFDYYVIGGLLSLGLAAGLHYRSRELEG